MATEITDPAQGHHNIHDDDEAEARKLGVSLDEVVVNRITEEDLNRISAESLNLYSKTGFRILLILAVMGFNQAGYGIDWAVIGNINSYDSWHDFFGFPNTGVVYGSVNALMTIGGFCGAPFLTLGDVIGRRGINFLGNAIVIVAAIMQGLAPNLGVFIAGRFLLGFGTSMCSAPQYMAEIAPLHIRGRLVGVFGACFQIGSICMSGGMVAFSTWSGNWQWRCPLLLQMLAPFLVCSLIYLWCPESPRYLMLKNRPDEAKAVIAKYMTSDPENVDQPIVGLVAAQIEESLESTRAGIRASYDFRVFFTKAVWYRTLVLAVYSVFQQWNGGGIIGYYMSPAMDTIGITSATSQTAINLGLTATYFVFTMVGAYVIDIFRRRTLIFAGLITFVIVQTLVTITSWQYSVTQSHATAALTVVWVFTFQVCSATLIATMHNLYPVEILSLPLRAKGMGMYSMFQSMAGVVQNYGISVGIGIVGYKIWVVYIVYNAVQLVIAYFLFPETSKLSLEEIDNVFETPGVNPVKLSKRIWKARTEMERLERTGGDTSEVRQITAPETVEEKSESKI